MYEKQPDAVFQMALWNCHWTNLLKCLTLNKKQIRAVEIWKVQFGISKNIVLIEHRSLNSYFYPLYISIECM